MIDADMRLVSRSIVMGQDKLLALLELHLARCELAETHLRSLCVENQRNHFARALRRRTHLVDAHEMLLMRAVGEVEPRAVHSVLDERVDDPVRVRCRTLCAYDLRLFQHVVSPPLSLKLITANILHSFR